MPLARSIYTFIYFILLPFFLVKLWFRSRTLGSGYHRVGERFSLGLSQLPNNVLWIHAVSVGETLAATPLIRLYQTQFPNRKILVTTITPTGSEQVKRIHGDSVYHCYLPYDLPWLIKRFINAVRPVALIVMETELWPNLMATCYKANVPVVLGNARLSESSANGYKKVAWLTRHMFTTLSAVAAQNNADAKRFIELGVAREKVSVMGSMKFDIKVDSAVNQSGEKLRKSWGAERPVLVLASGHEGEDEKLTRLLPRLCEHVPGLLLVLVPRHPERFDTVFEMANRRFSTHRRSQGEAIAPETQVYVADTMGEMLMICAAANVVLMGGSLVPHGGHNPIEPAALGKATVIGPYYENFLNVVESLVRDGACAILPTEDDALVEKLVRVLSNDELQNCMGRAGVANVKHHRGATERLRDVIEHVI